MTAAFAAKRKGRVEGGTMTPENAATADTEGLGIDRQVDRETVRRALNVLTEAPYFYREDDPALFQILRRRKASFAEFFKRYFGWELVVEGRCARLSKRGRPENPALRDSQRDAFNLTRRNPCLVFALLLEYFEAEARRTNWDYDRDENLRFFFRDFLEYAKRRFAELLKDQAPEDAALQKAVRETWDVLLKYRFIRYVEPTATERAEGAAERSELYEFLPAVYLYDAQVLSDPAWMERLKTSAEDDDSLPA